MQRTVSLVLFTLIALALVPQRAQTSVAMCVTDLVCQECQFIGPPHQRFAACVPVADDGMCQCTVDITVNAGACSMDGECLFQSSGGGGGGGGSCTTSPGEVCPASCETCIDIQAF